MFIQAKSVNLKFPKIHDSRISQKKERLIDE